MLLIIYIYDEFAYYCQSSNEFSNYATIAEDNRILQKRAQEASAQAAQKNRYTEAQYLELVEENKALKRYIEETEKGLAEKELFSPKRLFTSPAATSQHSMSRVSIVLQQPLCIPTNFL